jgi:spore cortex formation protein SpoVR/YcgB (stage V sporulation)
MKWAHETLKIINQLWGRPVELITMENGVEKTLVASEVK